MAHEQDPPPTVRAGGCGTADQARHDDIAEARVPARLMRLRLGIESETEQEEALAA